MRRRASQAGMVVAVVTVLACAGACRQAEAPAPPAAAAPAPGAGKIPVTTSSEDARREYLEGRSLAERLLVHDSIAHFDKAIALDPAFGLAELGRANSATSGADFLEHLKRAVAVVDTLSPGEKLLILAANAGSSGKAAEQRAHLEKLVADYPQDERAHFALGSFLFAQQDAKGAIEHYTKANTIAPNYSAPYNQQGYAYRQVGDYENAERSFKKYIELIPNDPNPYDSYGELLLKMGRFDESIVQYRKALAIDSNFLASHLGISAALMYNGKSAEAASEMKEIARKARSDADTRTAMFAETSLAVYTGKMQDALASLDRQYAVAEKGGDTLGMIGDLQGKAAIYTEMGKATDAQAAYEKSLTIVEASSVPDAIKANVRLFQHNNLARVALARKDLATAKKESDAFAATALASGNQGQARQAHELAGMIALQEKQWDTAIAELQQANQQNAYNHYRLALAWQGKGDAAQAKAHAAAAAHFYPLPDLNFAFIHAKAAKLAGDAS
jgi:tetratricopeptide (TPR) repeat protein